MNSFDEISFILCWDVAIDRIVPMATTTRWRKSEIKRNFKSRY